MALEETSENLFARRSACIYTSCYCEENVWKLCDCIRSKKPDVLKKCYCVFISNNTRMIPLWCQQSSDRSDQRVIWDYHVIFVYDGLEPEVYDLDTTLPFPCSFDEYVVSAIADVEDTLPENCKRYFRVIDAETFLKVFASDRSHMKNKTDGSYLSPPPSYSCIKTEDSVNNIQEFISMETEVGVGTVMNLQDFCEKFLKKMPS